MKIYLAATADERNGLNYGLLGDEDAHSANREWQAWAFEEIVLAPFGSARLLTAPSCRDGIGYSKSAIPDSALRHVERQLYAERVDLDAFRAVYGDWVAWGAGLGRRAPWKAEN